MDSSNYNANLYSAAVAAGIFDIGPESHTYAFDPMVQFNQVASSNYGADLHLVTVASGNNDYLNSGQMVADEEAIIRQINALPPGVKVDAPTIILPPLPSYLVATLTRDWGFPKAETCTVYPNVGTPSGPARIKPGQTRRYQPYRTLAARKTEHTNAGAGPSTLPPSAPPVGQPAREPSGGQSEKTADAGMNQTVTEEDEALEPRQTRVPQVKNKVQPDSRLRRQRDASRLTVWCWKRKGPCRQTLNQALTAAIDVVKTIREAVYEEPRLLVTGSEDAGNVAPEGGAARKAWDQRQLRNENRRLCQELSRYYMYATGKWTRSALLFEDANEMERLPDP